MKILFLVIILLVSPLTAQADEVVLGKVTEYLNGLTTVRSKFSQFSPDGSEVAGDFYLQRPGKMRWEYSPPEPILMVSTERMLTYYDKELDQISHIPLGDSLAGFLVKKEINFSDNTIEVLNASEEADIITLRIRQKEKPEDGELTLEFVTKPMRLSRMITSDTNGQETFVSFSNSEYGITLDKKLFIPPHKSVFEQK